MLPCFLWMCRCSFLRGIPHQGNVLTGIGRELPKPLLLLSGHVHARLLLRGMQEAVDVKLNAAICIDVVEDSMHA